MHRWTLTGYLIVATICAAMVTTSWGDERFSPTGLSSMMPG